MSRLQKKCFVASTGLHLLLALVLLIGPAFLASSNKPSDFHKIDFVPSMLVDQAMNNSGGARSVAATPAPPPVAPPLPAPAVTTPAPARNPEPAPPADPPRPAPTVNLTETTKPAQHKVVANLNPVVRKPGAANNSKPTNTARDKQADDDRQRIAEALRAASTSIKTGTAPATDVNTGSGEGSGASYANYRDFVGSKYQEAWLPPEHAENESSIVEATVTIARDGTVVSSRITRRSGDPDVDASVQRTLDRVTYIAPFPAGTTESQRTYPIIFDLKAKRLA